MDELYRRVDPEVLTAGFHKAEPGWISPVKDVVQTDFDIWYVAAGKGAVLIDGRWHSFEAGSLLTIAPGCSYQRERTDDADPFQIYFTHLLPFGRGRRELDRALARIWPRKMSLLHRPEFVGLFERLFEAFATRRAGLSLALKGLAMQLLHVIFEELGKGTTPDRPRADLSLLQARQMIEREYAQDLRLADIARHCGLSVSYLSALFTQHFGLPPVEYLLRVRLREARLLLARGTRVKEVADAVGFHSQHYFSRLFSKRTGSSPIRFSRLHTRK
jgi:AraC-like DNA-binding protein